MTATWLVSYPRSGSTWARFALMAALGDLAHPDLEQLDQFARAVLDRGEIDWMMDADSSDLTDIETLELRASYHRLRFARASPPPIVKVHDRWQRLPNGDSMHAADVTHGAIYLIRDPRDVVLSWSAFMGRDIDWAIRFLSDPNAFVGQRGRSSGTVMPEFLGSWSHHVRSWVDEAPYPVTVIRYEDMLADPGESLAQILAVTGHQVSAAAIDRAVAASRFDRMATLEQQRGFKDRPASADRFFRAGRSREWQTRLRPDQSEVVEKAHAEAMARFDYL